MPHVRTKVCFNLTFLSSYILVPKDRYQNIFQNSNFNNLATSKKHLLNLSLFFCRFFWFEELFKILPLQIEQLRLYLNTMEAKKAQKYGSRYSMFNKKLNKQWPQRSKNATIFASLVLPLYKTESFY